MVWLHLFATVNLSHVSTSWITTLALCELMYSWKNYSILKRCFYVTEFAVPMWHSVEVWFLWHCFSAIKREQVTNVACVITEIFQCHLWVLAWNTATCGNWRWHDLTTGAAGVATYAHVKSAFKRFITESDHMRSSFTFSLLLHSTCVHLGTLNLKWPNQVQLDNMLLNSFCLVLVLFRNCFFVFDLFSCQL